MSDKVNYRAKKMTRDSRILLNDKSIQQDDIAILEVCMPKKEAAKCLKETMIELVILDKSTITVGYFSTFLLTIDKTTRQNISEAMEEFNIINQQFPSHNYRIVHATTAENHFFQVPKTTS